MDFGFGFGPMGFGMFSSMFGIVYLLVIAMIFIVIIRNISIWHRNNHSPKLSVVATVVSKRTHISRHRHGVAGDMTGAHGFHSSTSTKYYATFQVESGDRMELQLQGHEYGMLIEGDRGTLTFQGTRYLGFERF